MNPFWQLVRAPIVASLISSHCLAQVVLSDPDPGVGESFGAQVAIIDDYAFVSETGPLWSISVGRLACRVHVFYRQEGGANAWGWIQTILAPDGDSVSFGSGIHAWGDWLAVYRGPHTASYLGASLCRDRTVFFYRNDNGVWVFDGVSGGESLSNEQCPFYFEGIWTGHLMNGQGNSLVLTTPTFDSATQSRVEVYNTINSGQWGLSLLDTTQWSRCALSGEQVVYRKGSVLRIVQSGAGDLIDSLDISGIAAFDARNGHLFTGVIDTNDTNGSSGRVVAFTHDAVQVIPCDTLVEQSASWFGSRVWIRGDRLLVQASNDQYYFYQNLGACQWTLVNTRTISWWGETVYGRRFDMNDRGDLISSLGIAGSWPPSYTVIIDPYTTWAHQEELSNQDADIVVQMDGTHLRACIEGVSETLNAMVLLFDISGRVVGSYGSRNLCAVGIDMSGLEHGVYVMTWQSSDFFTAVKTRW